MNPVEYIRRDAEGSDADTRRRAAADLLRALAEKFEGEVGREGPQGEGEGRGKGGKWEAGRVEAILRTRLCARTRRGSLLGMVREGGKGGAAHVPCPHCYASALGRLKASARPQRPLPRPLLPAPLRLTPP